MGTNPGPVLAIPPKNSNNARKFLQAALSPISIAPLITLRVAFGIMMLVSTIRFIALGWIEDHYLTSKVYFKYYGFEWVEPLVPWGMYVLHMLMVLAAIGITLGAWYQLSAIVFFLAFTYCELIDLTYYLNHYYFVSLIAFLLCLVPAGKAISLDQWFGTEGQPERSLNLFSIQTGYVWVFRLQAGLLYVYAGLAKINPEWLFEGLPLRIWLPAATSLPVIGPIFRWEATPYLFAWGGMLYDCLIPFLLMNRRTAIPAFGLVVSFHIMVGILFQIGIFPLVMIAVAPIFFPTDWHFRFWSRLANTRTIRPILAINPVWGKVLFGFLAVYFAFQILFPWRYLLYPGNMFWTEEGYRFGWRVMLMEKSGSATFFVKDRCTGKEGIVDNSEFLKPHQEKQMAMQPDMILQYAHFLHEHYEKAGMCDPLVRCEDYVTLNGRPGQLLVDTNADLSRIRDGWAHKSWILPFKDKECRSIHY